MCSSAAVTVAVAVAVTELMFRDSFLRSLVVRSGYLHYCCLPINL